MEKTVILTRYEMITTALSIIAILVSILVPLFQWIWKNWIVSAKVNIYPTGQATLFFNQSGSYLRFNSVIESERSASTIKNMSIYLSRRLDDRRLNLVWSCIISPVNQNMLGNYIHTMEAAHPFRVEADSIACAFIEYSDPSDSAGKKIRKICNDLNPTLLQIAQEHSYNEALEIINKNPEYIDAKNHILPDFFWEIGHYDVVVTIKYGKQNTTAFHYSFYVSKQNYTDLQKNIDEVLITKVKEHYSKPLAYSSPVVEITDKST